MPECQTCKKRYEPWVQLKENIYNPDILNHFHKCLNCYFRDVKIKELEDRISTQKWQINEAKKNMKMHKSNLSILEQELLDLEYEKFGWC
jgi:C4-type Zn-finger protein